MKKVVKCAPPIVELCSDNASEDKFYTLDTKSGRPFVLVRANATVSGNKEEDQWHFVAIGSQKNRKTGYQSFDDAINGAFKKDGNELKEHETQEDAYKYLAKVAKKYEK